MNEKSKKIVGFVALGLAAVALILAIVGMVTPNVTGDASKGGVDIKLFDDIWEYLEKALNASPTLSIIGFVVAIIGAAALVAHIVLKVFLNKNIKVIGILATVATAIGGILAFVGAAIVAGKLNTLNGTINNLQVYDPAVGAILGIVAAVLAIVAGVLGTSKKFN